MRTEVEAQIEKALLRGERWNVIAKTLHVSNRTIAKVSKRLGELSPSQVFKMFDEGRSPIDIVMKTNQDPAKIKQWFKDWIEMHEDMKVWRELKARIPSAVDKDGDKHEKEGKERDWRDYFKKETTED